MPDWDENSPQLTDNLARLLCALRDSARHREELTIEGARHWHRAIMEGLTFEKPEMAGGYRGDAGLPYNVRVGPNWGTPVEKVAIELRDFEGTLATLIARLDENMPVGAELNDKKIEAVLTACAWVHAEWVRIHPFVNGNGRIARIWANVIAMRYGLPPFVRLRPRPDGSQYAQAGAAAMQGDHHPTIEHFKAMFEAFISD